MTKENKINVDQIASTAQQVLAIMKKQQPVKPQAKPPEQKPKCP